MKQVILATLALLILAACGGTTPTQTPTPRPVVFDRDTPAQHPMLFDRNTPTLKPTPIPIPVEQLTSIELRDIRETNEAFWHSGYLGTPVIVSGTVSTILMAPDEEHFDLKLEAQSRREPTVARSISMTASLGGEFKYPGANIVCKIGIDDAQSISHLKPLDDVKVLGIPNGEGNSDLVMEPCRFESKVN